MSSEAVFGIELPNFLKLTDLYTGIGLMAFTNLMRIFTGGSLSVAGVTSNVYDLATNGRLFATGTAASIVGRYLSGYLHGYHVFSAPSS